LSEAELTARARAGDVDAFERLVQQSAGKALAGARRILGRPCDAEDALQSGVLKAMQRLESFRGDSQFGTWLHSIVVRTALDMLRARRERGLGGEVDGDGQALPHPEHIADFRADVSAEVHRREFRELLEAELERLSEGQRLVFVLRDIEGMSVKETAETLGLSVSNVKVRLMRARLTLRERLSRLLGEGPVHRPSHDHAAFFAKPAESAPAGGEEAEA
jgi:RNA polymerase sigma-70 factor (ECF subfamily)